MALDAEKKRREDERRKASRERHDSPENKLDRYNQEKAKKLMTFANDVLTEFARETNSTLRYQGTRAGDYRTYKCLACYKFNKTTKAFLFPKGETIFDIVIGHQSETSHYIFLPTRVLLIGVTSFGGDVSIENINRNWLLGILAKLYEEWRPLNGHKYR